MKRVPVSEANARQLLFNTRKRKKVFKLDDRIVKMRRKQNKRGIYEKRIEVDRKRKNNYVKKIKNLARLVKNFWLKTTFKLLNCF